MKMKLTPKELRKWKGRGLNLRGALRFVRHHQKFEHNILVKVCITASVLLRLEEGTFLILAPSKFKALTS